MRSKLQGSVSATDKENKDDVNKCAIIRLISQFDAFLSFFN